MIKNLLAKTKAALSTFGSMMVVAAFKAVFFGAYLLVGAMTLTGVALIAFALYPNGSINQKSDAALAATSVKIVRLDGRSGGSGVVLSSSPTLSVVLTNGHVCGVVEHGGLVISDGESHAVRTYKKSFTHDLCLITVAADLHMNTHIARHAPLAYTGAAAVGHPKLLPTIVTRGHWSGREMVQVMIEMRPCTDKDLEEDPDNGMLCTFLGGIPVIRTYEAQIATVLISPGSSGSPVFDDNGDIAGLVFAGSGDIGNAMIVPQEFIANFVYVEADQMGEVLPNATVELNAKALKGSANSEENLNERFDKLCADKEASASETVKNLCRIHGRDITWRH